MISFKDFLSKLHEEAGQGVDEDWFKQGSFETAKKSVPIKYRIASEAGTTQTKEGPVRHEAGHAIMTGTQGEEWPVAPEKFKELYDTDEKAGTATPKRIAKTAKLADHDGTVKASWGDLEYKKGQDYIVRHGPGDYGVVKKDIFANTYEPEPLKCATCGVKLPANQPQNHDFCSSCVEDSRRFD